MKGTDRLLLVIGGGVYGVGDAIGRLEANVERETRKALDATEESAFLARTACHEQSCKQVASPGGIQVCYRPMRHIVINVIFIIVDTLRR